MWSAGNDTAATTKNRNGDHAHGHEPEPEDTVSELATATRQYKELASQIGDLGLIHHGSVIHRHAEPDISESGVNAQRRGRSPYYQWSSKVQGKTITRTVTKDEADLYREWIENDRKLRFILKEMRRTSEHATQLILKQKVK